MAITKKVELAPDIPLVDETMGYKERAKLLVEASKRFGRGGCEEADYHEEYWITPEGLESLLFAGASIQELNRMISDRGDHCSRVVYDGRQFACGHKDDEIFSAQGYLNKK